MVYDHSKFNHKIIIQPQLFNFREQIRVIIKQRKNENMTPKAFYSPSFTFLSKIQRTNNF